MFEDTFSRNQLVGENTSCGLSLKRSSLGVRHAAAISSTSDNLMELATLAVRFETPRLRQVLLGGGISAVCGISVQQLESSVADCHLILGVRHICQRLFVFIRSADPRF